MIDHQQELFNRVAKHLLTQNKQAKLPDGRCRYRTPDGLSCAVGCLIVDEYYDADFEGIAVCGYGSGEKIEPELLLSNALAASIGYEPSYQDILVLQELQNLHDNHDPEYWEDKLKEAAGHFGLEFNV